MDMEHDGLDYIREAISHLSDNRGHQADVRWILQYLLDELAELKQKVEAKG